MELTKSRFAHIAQDTIATLDAVHFPLDLPGSEQLRETRAQLLTMLRARIVPHVLSSDVPAVVVFGGSSGAGKSTLFNSILGTELSPASVLRPTTRMPYIAVHPHDMAALEGHGLLRMGKVVPTTYGIEHVILVDAPDLDSVDAANRELSRRLLDAADLWIFVTTAHRYGDAFSWNTLLHAHQMGVTSAVILNRVPSKVQASVRKDLMTRMAENGLETSPLMIVSDAGPHEGLLDAQAVEEVRAWIQTLARSQMASALVDRTTQALIPQLNDRLLFLADGLDTQAEMYETLKREASRAAEPVERAFAASARAGRFGGGAPEAVWLSQAADKGALASLVARVQPHFGKKKARRARDEALIDIAQRILRIIEGIIQRTCGNAEDAIVREWEASPVNTAPIVEDVKGSVQLDSIAAQAVSRFVSDIDTLDVVENEWLFEPGVRALIIVAASGVAGAVKAADFLSLNTHVRQARDILARCGKEAIGEVIRAYVAGLSRTPISQSAGVRLRAAEFLGATHYRQ